MSAISPVDLTHIFAEDPDASGMVDLSELDGQFDLLVAAHQAHNDLFASLMRGDLTLKDSLIRSRNLHPEVVGLLQLVAQSTAGGLHILPACRVASTGNLTLSAPQTVDGIAVIANDLVLAKDQTDPSENGLYQVNAGAWTRVVTAASWDDLTSGFVWVDNGTANRLSAWAVDIDAGGTIDIDPVAFQLVYRAAPLLADLDPSLLPTAVSIAADDYFIFHDVSAGALRRQLISALPFLSTATTHGDLGGLGDDDHPQYHTNARGDLRYSRLAHEHDFDELTGIATPDQMTEMVGCTPSVDGEAGTVPAPEAGTPTKFLRNDGVWAVPDATNAGIAKAWVVFDGATAVIAASHQVTSVVRDSAGNYTITMPGGVFATANYAMVGSARRRVSNRTPVVAIKDDTDPTSTVLKVQVRESATDPSCGQFVDADCPHVSVVLFGA